MVQSSFELPRLIRVKPAALWGLWAVALAALLMSLGAPAVMRSQEARVLQTAREMLQSGGQQWLVPRANGNIRVEKPPLAYWLAAGSFWLFGQSDFAGRLPFALAGWLHLPLVLSLGRRWLGPRAGLISAAALGSSLFFIRHSRLAETDILASLFVTLAIWAVVTARDSQNWRRFALYHVGAVGIGLAAMAKGPPAVCVILFLIAWCLVERDWRPLRGFVSSGAIFTATVLAGWWFAYIRTTPQWPTIVREMRMVAGGVDHPDWFIAYVPQLLLGLAPWSAIAVLGFILLVIRSGWPRAIERWLKRAKNEQSAEATEQQGAEEQLAEAGAIAAADVPSSPDRHSRAALIWFAAMFLPLLAVQNRQPHYLVTTLPAASLWVGYAVDAAMRSLGARAESRAARGLFAGTLLVLLAGGPAILWIARQARGFLQTSDLAMSALVVFMAAGLIAMARNQGLGRTVMALAIAAAMAWSAALGRWLPSLELADYRSAMLQVRSELGGGPVVFYGDEINLPIVYYLREVIPRAGTREELARLLEARPDSIVVAMISKKASAAAPGGLKEIMSIELKRHVIHVYQPG